LTGRNLTITEYGIGYAGERKARGGVRIDLADLDIFISELQRIQEVISKDSSIIERGTLIR